MWLSPSKCAQSLHSFNWTVFTRLSQHLAFRRVRSRSMPLINTLIHTLHIARHTISTKTPSTKSGSA